MILFEKPAVGSLWRPSLKLWLQVAHQHITMNICTQELWKLSQGLGWAAFKRKRTFRTPSICFERMHIFNRSTDLNEFCTESCTVVFSCAPWSLNLKMLFQRVTVLKTILCVVYCLILVYLKLGSGDLIFIFRVLNWQNNTLQWKF